MRVALVVPKFPNVSETFVVSRFMALLQRGWDIHVICAASTEDDWVWFPEAASNREVRKRVHVRPFAPGRVRALTAFPIALIRTLASAPVRTLRYLLRGWKPYGRGLATHFVEDAVLIRLAPDVLHHEFGHFAVRRAASADLLGCALVASFQGYDLNYVGLDREPGFYDALWKRIDAAHFVSRDLHERAKRRGFPSDGPAFVVSNGVDSARFDGRREPHTEVTGTNERPVRLLSVGRLHWKKGYDYALAAARLLEDAGIVCDYRIVGDGEYRDAVLFARSDLGLESRVTLLGARSASDVREELMRADVLIHPATSEGFCLAVTEAQLMHVPVVVTDADGLRDNASHGETGFVVPRRDPRAIADRVAELARDPALRDRMGQAGRERAQKLFGIDAYVDGMEDVYRSAAATLRSHRPARWHTTDG